MRSVPCPKVDQEQEFGSDLSPQVRNFLNTTVYHILRRTGALTQLSDVERARHINQLVDRSVQNITHEGHLPQLKKSKSLAKDVVHELQLRFGENLQHRMLEECEDTEFIILTCLQKHSNRLFEGAVKKKRSSLTPPMWYRLL